MKRTSGLERRTDAELLDLAQRLRESLTWFECQGCGGDVIRGHDRTCIYGELLDQSAWIVGATTDVIASVQQSGTDDD